MGLEDLIAALERETGARAEKAIAAAHAEARRIEAEAADESKKSLDTAIARKRAAEQAITERALAVARKEAARRLINVRRATFARVLDEARAMLADQAAKERFRALLPALVRRARDELREESLVVRCSPQLIADLGRLLSDRPNTHVAVDPAAGRLGFLARGVSAKTAVDVTVDARLAQLEPELAIEVAGKIGASS